MKKSLSLAFLAGGVMLSVFGLNEMNSLASDISEALTGAPTDRSMWLIVGGVMLAVLGAAGLMLQSRRR